VARPALTDAIQDYLKAIYKLQEDDARVSVTALAREQSVAAGSASEMVKKLGALDLVDHEPYKGVKLTQAGERVAVEVIRHHRLLELYLAETLGLHVDEVHDEADRLEHVLSEELEARIDEKLGYPTHDPHGDPIPDAGLNVERSELRSLEALEPGEEATVKRVPDGDADLLRYLAKLALVPGGRVTMRRSEPFGGPLTVLVSGQEHAISRELAGQIGVA
jgi:DtxR family Mn-dependent transcriptional regulator